MLDLNPIPVMEETTQEAEPYQLFSHLWDSAILDIRAERENGHTGERKFWASNIGGCLRASMYSRLNAPVTNPFGAGQLERFEIGNYVEAQILDLLHNQVVKQGVGSIWRQVRVENKYHMAKTDGVLVPSEAHFTFNGLTISTPLPIPIEIKSLHPMALDRRERECHGWKPYEHHCLQLCQFIALSKDAGEPMADHGILMYQSLDGRRRTVTVYLADWEQELRRRWSVLEKNLADETLPDKLERDEYPCTVGKSYCLYFGNCWSME